MEFWAVILVGLAGGLILVIGGAFVVYMGGLVKSAYQLKVEIKTETDAKQKQLEEEVEKKLRWVKRDLIEEVDKVKTAMQIDNQRKISETLDVFITRLSACEEALLHDRTEATKLLEALRNDVTILGQRFRLLRREQKASQTITPTVTEEITSASLDNALLEPVPEPVSPDINEAQA
jgi:hypothetical protein